MFELALWILGLSTLTFVLLTGYALLLRPDAPEQNGAKRYAHLAWFRYATTAAIVGLLTGIVLMMWRGETIDSADPYYLWFLTIVLAAMVAFLLFYELPNGTHNHVTFTAAAISWRVGKQEITLPYANISEAYIPTFFSPKRYFRQGRHNYWYEFTEPSGAVHRFEVSKVAAGTPTRHIRRECLLRLTAAGVPITK